VTEILIALGTGGLASAAVTALLLHSAASLPHAAPNARSLHRHPVPRVGGLAIWAGFLPVAAWVGVDLPGGFAGWLPAWLAILAISLRDDMSGAPVPVRLAVHLAAALWIAAWLTRMPGSMLPGVVPGGRYLVAVAVFALAIVWAANLYNFMDGSDGVAGATTLIGFAAYAAAADADQPLRLASLAIAAAALPFLAVNRPPARMFLGDVGAVPAGFLAAVFGIGGALRGDWPAWFPLLVFLPFVGDASWTLVRRLLRGERVWEAHRMHCYQRLNQLGAGHGGTLVLYAGITAATALTAVVCRSYAPASGAAALLAWCIALAVLFAAIDYHWRRKPSATR
jgi:UDP-N-acetylmuramyl pentapeptide phosphotransferase/UDP-N-acetylglucosamine-1-phosphate transferase